MSAMQQHEEKLTELAARLAIRAHEGQRRKSDRTPYIIHPFMCALKLTDHDFSDVIVSAALVHDVLEDTEVTELELRDALGDAVVDIVCVVSEKKELPWEERKKEYVEAVRKGPESAKAVSIADKIHNMQSLLTAYDRDGDLLWEKFNRSVEKKLWFEELCLSMFKETWDHPLIDEYEELVAKMRLLG